MFYMLKLNVCDLFYSFLTNFRPSASNILREAFYKLIFKLCELKALNMFGNCQRPVFSPGVSQHMRKITSLWKFELINWTLKLQENDERKNILVVLNIGFQIEIKGSSKKYFIILVRNYLFVKNYFTSEEVGSHNVLYY